MDNYWVHSQRLKPRQIDQWIGILQRGKGIYLDSLYGPCMLFDLHQRSMLKHIAPYLKCYPASKAVVCCQGLKMLGQYALMPDAKFIQIKRRVDQPILYTLARQKICPSYLQFQTGELVSTLRPKTGLFLMPKDYIMQAMIAACNEPIYVVFMGDNMQDTAAKHLCGAHIVYIDDDLSVIPLSHEV